MCQGQHPFVGHGRRSLCDGHGNPDPKQNGYLLIIAHMSKVGSKATSDPCPVGRDREVFVFLSDWAAGNVIFVLGKLFLFFFFLGLGIRELFFLLDWALLGRFGTHATHLPPRCWRSAWRWRRTSPRRRQSGPRVKEWPVSSKKEHRSLVLRKLQSTRKRPVQRITPWFCRSRCKAAFLSHPCKENPPLFAEAAQNTTSERAKTR